MQGCVGCKTCSLEPVTSSCCRRAPHDRPSARAGSRTRAAGGKLWQGGESSCKGPGGAMDAVQCPCICQKRTGLKYQEERPRLLGRLGTGLELQ